jgi:hypothetical protein
MADELRASETTITGENPVAAGRKRWAPPMIVVSVVSRVTAAKTSSGFGFETHSPGSLNGS